MEFGHELSTASLLKLVSFLFWSGLYLWWGKEAPGKNPEWYSRAVTLLHGSVAAAIGWSQCNVRSLTQCRLTTKILPRHYALMVWSWGYFAFDLLWCLAYWTESALILCHHTSALVAITIYMRKEYTGCRFACMLTLLEITNPPLQMRWFLKNEGYDKTIIYYIVEVTYLVMFLTVRGVLGSCLTYKILNSDLFDMDEKLISIVIYFVSMALIYEIMGYIVHRYMPKIF